MPSISLTVAGDKVTPVKGGDGGSGVFRCLLNDARLPQVYAELQLDRVKAAGITAAIQCHGVAARVPARFHLPGWRQIIGRHHIVAHVRQAAEDAVGSRDCGRHAPCEQAGYRMAMTGAAQDG